MDGESHCPESFYKEYLHFQGLKGIVTSDCFMAGYDLLPFYFKTNQPDKRSRVYFSTELSFGSCLTEDINMKSKEVSIQNKTNLSVAK